MEERRHHVDGQSDNDGAEEKRQQGMAQCGSSYHLRSQVGVGNLKGQTDREGHVGKVEIVGSALLVEVDSAWCPAVVDPGIAKREDGVDSCPRQRHAHHSDGDQQRLGSSLRMACFDEHEADSPQTGNPGDDDDQIGDTRTGVLLCGDMCRAVRIQMADRRPYPDQEYTGGSIPAQQQCGLPRHYQGRERSHDATGDSTYHYWLRSSRPQPSPHFPRLPCRIFALWNDRGPADIGILIRHLAWRCRPSAVGNPAGKRWSIDERRFQYWSFFKTRLAGGESTATANRPRRGIPGPSRKCLITRFQKRCSARFGV